MANAVSTCPSFNIWCYLTDLCVLSVSEVKFLSCLGMLYYFPSVLR